MGMDQEQRRRFLIEYLLSEGNFQQEIPDGELSQKKLLRALFNVRMPKAAGEAFLNVQDEYLQEEIRRKGVTDLADLSPIAPDIYLWKGDITALKCDGIVNAANSQMLGCFCPNHGCIDNAIHTFAGVQLRLECDGMMRAQHCKEGTGQAKITKAYNLPCKYVLHTVGPTVCGNLTQRHKQQLASCYRSCLSLADRNGLKSIAFCCISTGEFHFPNAEAAQIAIATVKDYKAQLRSAIKVVFNVFKEADHVIYAKLLGRDR